MARFGCALAAAAMVTLATAAAAQTTPPPTPPPVPKPFPGATGKPGEKPAQPTAAEQTKLESAAAIQIPGDPPVYPGAEFLKAYDAGRNQQYYLFGTNQPYGQIVQYYRDVLKRGGDDVSRTPAIHQFELGRFDANTMAYPPSIVVKDQTWNGSEGYLFVTGTTSQRYRTIIQIVAAPVR